MRNGADVLRVWRRQAGAGQGDGGIGETAFSRKCLSAGAARGVPRGKSRMPGESLGEAVDRRMVVAYDYRERNVRMHAGRRAWGPVVALDEKRRPPAPFRHPGTMT